MLTRVFDIVDSDDAQIIQNSNGTLSIAGTTNSYGQGGAEQYLFCIDLSGNILWAKTYGGGNNDFAQSLVKSSNGGYAIAGYTQSYGAGLADAYVVRIDSSGDTLWTKVVGGTEVERALSICEMNDGSFVIVGKSDGFGGLDNDLFVFKLDALGDTLWTKRFGGFSEDEGRLVRPTPDGGVLVVGVSGSFGDGGIYAVRLTSGGDSLWTKHYGGTCGEGPYAMQTTYDGGFIIAGETCSFGASAFNAFLLNIDSLGTVNWMKTYRFDSNVNNVFYGVQQTTDGGYIAVGASGSLLNPDLYLVKTDVNGDAGCGDSLVAVLENGTNTEVGPTTFSETSGGVQDSLPMSSNHGGTLAICTCLASVAVSEKWMDTPLNVHPNPGTEYLLTDILSLNNQAVFKIYSLVGELLYHQTLTDEVIPIDYLVRGIYLLKIESDNHVWIEKFVKE